jgi:hypothetical protein
LDQAVYLKDGAKAMKTQAWGWLLAGVLAAGLNASYHDGGLEWAHQALDHVERNVSVVLALASGRADQFVAEVQPVAAREETASCRMATALARVHARFVQSQFARSEREWDRLAAQSEEISARQQAAASRLEAHQAQMEARLQAHIQQGTDGMRALEAVEVSNLPDCAHVRVNIAHVHVPQVHVPEVEIPEVQIPEVHIPQVHIPQIHVPALPPLQFEASGGSV